MKQIILLLIIYSLFVFNIKKVKSEKYFIPKEAIRIRILANSNSGNDQNIKMKLSIEIEKRIQELLKDTTDIDEAKKIIKQNIKTINEYVEEILKKEGYNQKYSVIYGNNYFPNKEYNGVNYKEGFYESLLITLGNGKGNNWWCVLFPPLCLMETEELDNSQYKLFVKELFEKYL